MAVAPSAFVGVPVSSIKHLGLPLVPSPQGIGDEAGSGAGCGLAPPLVVGVVVVVVVDVVPSGFVVVVAHATLTGLFANVVESLFGATVQLVCDVVVPFGVCVVVLGPVTFPSAGLTICAGFACVVGCASSEYQSAGDMTPQ